MCEFDPKNKGRRMDPCMQRMIEALNFIGIKTVACCCGHGRYPRTIVLQVGKSFIEMHSGAIIERKRRFYRRDADGYYFIPEAVRNG